IVCFWNGFSESLVYAYVTCVGLPVIYTLNKVPYGVFNASFARDTDESTKLTAARMFMANLGCLHVGYGVPIVVQCLSPDGKINSRASGDDWFITMTTYAIVGLCMLVFCYKHTKERVVMNEKDTEKVKASDLWVEFKHNSPLRALPFFF